MKVHFLSILLSISIIIIQSLTLVSYTKLYMYISKETRSNQQTIMPLMLEKKITAEMTAPTPTKTTIVAAEL